MVKIQSSVGMLKGRLGGMRFYEVNGVNIGAALPSKVHNPKTVAQVKQRVKLNNILALYRVMGTALKSNFEGLIGNKNASTFFRSYNLMRTPVWITQEQKAECRAVIAPYVVAQGRMRSVVTEWRDGWFVSNIALGSEDITADTPLRDLDYALRHNNDDWGKDNTLQVVLLRQPLARKDDDGARQPSCSALTLTLKQTGTIGRTPLHDTDHGMSRPELYNLDGRLAVRVAKQDDVVYGCAIVHGRGEGRERMVSTQQLVLSCSELYDHFTASEALEAALDSYKAKR